MESYPQNEDDEYLYNEMIVDVASGMQQRSRDKGKENITACNGHVWRNGKRTISDRDNDDSVWKAPYRKRTCNHLAYNVSENISLAKAALHKSFGVNNDRGVYCSDPSFTPVLRLDKRTQYCDTTFFRSVKDHLKKLHIEDPQYICNRCQKSVKGKSNIQQH